MSRYIFINYLKRGATILAKCDTHCIILKKTYFDMIKKSFNKNILEKKQFITNQIPYYDKIVSNNIRE